MRRLLRPEKGRTFGNAGRALVGLCFALVLGIGVVAPVQAQTPPPWLTDSYCNQIAQVEHYPRDAIVWALEQEGVPSSNRRAQDLLAYPRTIAAEALMLARIARQGGSSRSDTASTAVLIHVRSLLQEDAGTPIPTSEVERGWATAEVQYCAP